MFEEVEMILETTDIIAIIIALLGCITMMCLFWRQNVALQKQNIRLRKRIVEIETKSLFHK